jgi:hypothetical protein
MLLLEELKSRCDKINSIDGKWNENLENKNNDSPSAHPSGKKKTPPKFPHPPSKSPQSVP